MCHAVAVKTVDVLVPGDLPEGDLVQPRERHLATVCVAGKHERDIVRPEAVGLLGDMGKPQRGDVLLQTLESLLPTSMPCIRIIQAQHLKLLVSQSDGGVV